MSFKSCRLWTAAARVDRVKSVAQVEPLEESPAVAKHSKISFWRR